ncbi:phage antirepressor [Corynebacterium silvaticum]|nr:phage antirepressor KilAC domain-containing protein [Corynebacterium silvaticum]
MASDVAKVLGYRDAANMTRRLDADEKGTRSVSTSQVSGDSSARAMTVITEAGLYSAIFASRLDQAKEFKKWVTAEVLPSIRKYGAYMTPATIEQVITDPDTIIYLASKLKEEQERTRQLEAPAAAWNQLAEAEGDYSVAQAAKVLSRDPAISIGRDRLFAHMEKLGWIFRPRGARRRHWEASQAKAIDTHRLVHKLGKPFRNPHTGSMEVPSPTIRVTPKGLKDLHKTLGGGHPEIGKKDMTHAHQESGIDIHLATCREDLLAAAPRFFRKLTPAEADDMTSEVIRLLKRNGWNRLTMPVSAFLTIANYYAR